VPGESGRFHIIIQGPTSSNGAKATYQAQYVGVDSAGNQVLLHPTAEELQVGATSTAATPTATLTSVPSPDATAVSPTTTSPDIGQ
jgi:hypothetical protein